MTMTYTQVRMHCTALACTDNIDRFTKYTICWNFKPLN